MARYQETDLLFTRDGDLVFDENDLKLTAGPDFVVQSVYNRLKSVKVDWYYDNAGADLEDYLGQPNIPETGKAIEQRVIQSLTEDGLLDSDNIFVKVVPINRTAIATYVFVKLPEMTDPLQFKVLINLDGDIEIEM
jgi:hypothetical protein